MERPFDQPENCATFTDIYVINEWKPVLIVSHNDEDHDRDFLSGLSSWTLDECIMIWLKNVVDRDPTLYDIADLEPWYVAVRSEIWWERSIYPHDEYFAESEDNE
jgi:hypothetical protein